MKVATRIGVSLALAAAFSLGIGLPTPHELPAVALGSQEVLWGERTLMFFYALLLLFVPLVRGLQGQLPIELSTRGRARWQVTAAASEEALATLDERVNAVSDRVKELSSLMANVLDRLAAVEQLMRFKRGLFRNKSLG